MSHIGFRTNEIDIVLIGFQTIDKVTRCRLELLTGLYDGIICSTTLFKGLAPINER